ncbi:MAG: Wadjet anti-phage system protein JetD domain-containing protein [Sediminibacterium sp.]
MIQPGDIKIKALKWWPPLLESYVKGEVFFPKSIEKIGKIKAGDITNNYGLLYAAVKELYSHSKNNTGAGYSVKTIDKKFRRTGEHELPDAIEFETLEDYLAFTSKKKDWIYFTANYTKLISVLPALKEWCLVNVLALCDHSVDWDNIIKVCNYFLEVPRPHLYIRQLPIKVHTKFIQENEVLLQSLLDFLIPGHIRDSVNRKFEERYYLKYSEPLVRIRNLDERVESYLGLYDLSLPLSDFEKRKWKCKYVFIAENKMNFLTLPNTNDAIAIWSGGGFMVSYLKNADWLKGKEIFYWGDIDEHGFQVLHQIRSYFPRTTSLMMDMETYESFKQFAVQGKRNKAEILHLLNVEENLLYQYLKSNPNHNRLEQEKIHQSYVERKILERISS